MASRGKKGTKKEKRASKRVATHKRAAKTARATKTAASPYKLEFEKSAGAVVAHRDGELHYLLIHSTYWEYPKGRIDADESETEAARREVREETGLDVELLPGFRRQIDYFYRRRDSGLLVKKQVIYFAALAPCMDVKISWEHNEARWLTFKEALELLQYENARETLLQANEFFLKNQA